MYGLDVCKWHMDASSKCNELLLHKKGNQTAYPVLHNIKQNKLLSPCWELQYYCTCKFSLHVKAKLNEANNYLKPIFILKLIFI